MREAAEEESRRLKAEERRYAEMRRAEAEARRAAESRQKAQEIEEKTRQQQEAELREQKEREEAFKRQRERRQREQRWNIGPWTPIRALERYRVLSEAFDTTKFNAHDPLSFHVVPWPILTPPARMSVEDVDWNAVESFFDAVKSHMRTQEFKMFVEKSQRRFHPDRWRARGLLKTVENEAERSCLEVGEWSLCLSLSVCPLILMNTLQRLRLLHKHSRLYGGISLVVDVDVQKTERTKSQTAVACCNTRCDPCDARLSRFKFKPMYMYSEEH